MGFFASEPALQPENPNRRPRGRWGESIQHGGRVPPSPKTALLPPRGGSPFPDPPGPFLFFLYHPFRRHFCFCADSAGSRRAWKAALRDGIRYGSTGEAAETPGTDPPRRRPARIRPRRVYARRARAARGLYPRRESVLALAFPPESLPVAWIKRHRRSALSFVLRITEEGFSGSGSVPGSRAVLQGSGRPLRGRGSSPGAGTRGRQSAGAGAFPARPLRPPRWLQPLLPGIFRSWETSSWRICCRCCARGCCRASEGRRGGGSSSGSR